MNKITLIKKSFSHNKPSYKSVFTEQLVKRSILFLVYLFFYSACFTQTYSQLNKSDTIIIQSKAFDTERKVIITKPNKINGNKKETNYIIYLDADNPDINSIFLQSANNLMANKEIPNSYLIGVIHQDRNKELVEKDKLLQFLKEELIPIFKNKHTDSIHITIAGHSFGGYFATYAFIRENGEFKACIAVSPAYWPNNHDVINLLKDQKNTIQGSYFLASGDKRWDEISLIKDIRIVKDIIKDQKNITFQYIDLKGFSHNATPTVGFGLGLNFIYDEWEWINILEEQESMIKKFPNFWGHLEIKADALFHLKRFSEAKYFYHEALKNIPNDEYSSKAERKTVKKRLHNKMKKLL